MTENRFPPGWSEERVQRVLDHYEDQADEVAVAEDEERLDPTSHTIIEVPADLVSTIRDLIAKRRAV